MNHLEQLFAQAKADREERKNSEEEQRRIKTEAAVIAVIAENKCTVAEAITILDDARKVIMQSATVPVKDYFAEVSEHW